MTTYYTKLGRRRSKRQPTIAIVEVFENVSCPRCHAPVGERCRKVDGSERMAQHRARWVLARQVIK